LVDAGREPVEDGDDPADPAGRADGEADEAGPVDDAAAAGRDPRRFNDWRKRSATGAVMTGIALGLKEALELPTERPALVIEAPGEPDDPDRPIDLHFDPDDPAATVAIVRHREDGDGGGAAGRP
jgi:hypothetical protein